MTAAVNHPTLRLIRHQIGPIEISTLSLGGYMEVSAGMREYESRLG